MIIQIKPEEFLQGIISATHKEKGIQMQRFTKEQYSAYDINVLYRTAVKSSAGICIAMRTTANNLVLEYEAVSQVKVFGGYLNLFREPRTVYQLDSVKKTSAKHQKFKKDVHANGRGEKGFPGNCFDLLIEGKYQYSRSIKGKSVSFCLNNPKHKSQEIQIYLPFERILSLKSLEIDGTAKPVSKDKLLCLGDSITHGGNNIHAYRIYAVQLARGLELELINQGISGYVFCKDSLRGLENLPFVPQYITVAYGTNDWQFATDYQVAKNNMRAYLKELYRRYPNVPVFVITPIWRADEKSPYAMGDMKQWRKTIEAEAEKYANMIVIDGLLLIPHDTSYYQDGMLHPNDAGSDQYAKNLLNAIKDYQRNNSKMERSNSHGYETKKDGL